MNNLSRRTFIGGAAAGVAAAAVPGLAAAASSPRDAEVDTSDLLGSVVARVRDLHTGEITLYAGTEEISYTDPALARRLARAATR